MEEALTSHNLEISSSDASFCKLRNTNKPKIIRGCIMGLIIIGISINCFLGYGLPHGDIDCMEDYSHSFTSPINKYLHENSTLKNFLTIISSLYMDTIVIGMGIFWTLRGKSWRFLTTALIFYIFRGLVQQTFQMKYPEGYLWDYPGFPSLSVSYLKTNDFFFSGHVGFPVIAACELSKNGRNYFAIIALCGSFVEFVIMIIMRGHYFIDLITGMIVSHYIFILVDKYIHVLDNSRISLKDFKDERDENNKSNLNLRYSEKGVRDAINLN